MLSYLYYKTMRGLLRLTYPHAETAAVAPLQEEPAVFVCNHSSVRGPVMMTLDFKRPHKTWAVSYATDKVHTRSFVFHDVFFGNSRRHKGFWRLASRIVAKGLPVLLTYSDTIPVCHDKGIVGTFKQSVGALLQGEDLLIFAESPARRTAYVNEIHPGFIDIARIYYRKTGKKLLFYPVYIEKKNAVISVGAPIAYDPDRTIEVQRGDIAEYLCVQIDRLARELPAHRPVPFLPPRWYAAYGQYEHDPAGYWRMIAEDKSFD